MVVIQCQISSRLVGRQVKAELNSHQPQHVVFGVPYKYLISQYHLIITAICIRGSKAGAYWTDIKL